MTPTEKWMIELALVYSVPAFIAGVGVTLLCVHRRDVGRAVAMMPRFLSPKLVFEGRGLAASGAAQAKEIP